MSRGATLIGSLTLVTEDCCSCGVQFAIPLDLRKVLLDTHRAFYCPNGHSQSYTGKSEAQKLREQLEAEQRRVIRLRESAKDAHDYATEQGERAKAAQRSAAAHKGQATKLRKRISAGVCPVDDCGQHFTDLEAHMASYHQGFEAEQAGEPS